MIRRTIAAALLAGLVSPALAAQFASPAYDQAAGLANGKTQADATYDGGASRGAVAAPVTAGSPAAASQTALAPARPALAAQEVPSPAKETTGKLFSVHNVLYGAGGAAVGAGLGLLILGGPLSALVGALAGAMIGISLAFSMSKMMR